MKKTEEFAVLRHKETGRFVVDYKSNGKTFAFSANTTSELRHAAKNDLEAIKEQKEQFEKIADALECEILVVEAEFTLKTLDGEEPKKLTEEIEKAKRKRFENFLRGLLANGDDYDTMEEV